MPILFVCHDTGNTTVLLDAADSLQAKDPNQKITFLIVGEAAQNIFSNRLHKPNVILLTDWLPQTTMKELTSRPLTDAEKTMVLAKLNELNPDKAITTSSCFPQAKIPYQIVEMLTERLVVDNNFIYNGDFFYDLHKNPVWITLPCEWTAHVSFLLAMAEEARRMKAVKSNLACHVVGSSAIDKMLEQQFDAQKIQRTLQELAVTAEQQLLFISGSKEINEDKGLLDELYAKLKGQQTTAIRMGLHPGTQDMQGYVQGILDWLAAHADFSARLIITDNVKKMLTDTAILQNDNLLVVNLGGDAVFPAANAVASALPSTIVTQAILQGKKAYCVSKNVATSYLSRFFATDPATLAVAGAGQEKPTKTVLGLPNEPAVALIADRLLEVHENRPRR
jgi:hypothetical protein